MTEDLRCRAVLDDGNGPPWVRLIPSVLGLLVLAAAVGFSDSAWVVPYAIGVTLIAGARFLPRGARRRSAKLELLDGRVKITAAGIRNDVIRARDVRGATSTRTRDGYRLTLSHTRRPAPITIEVESLDALKRLCRSLGIGTRGHGSVAFTATPSGAHVFESVVRLTTCAFALAIPVFLWSGLEALAALSLLGTIAGGAIAALLALVRVLTPPKSLALDAQSVQILDRRAYPWVAYAEIEALTPIAGGFVAATNSRGRKESITVAARRVPLVPEGMDEDDRALFHDLVMTAVARAKGQTAPMGDVGNAVAELGRRSGETSREWLARIDAMAAAPAVAYRGGTLTREQIANALEDTDLPIDVRVAAARMLGRDPEERRLRVAPVIAAEHDERVRVRIAAAEGSDDALLELLDQDEPKALHFRRRER